MYFATIITILSAAIIAVAGIPAAAPRAGCTISSYSQVSSVVKSCKNIEVSGFTVPGGQTLELDLQKGSKVTFKGTIKFEHKEWEGPLIKIKGSQIDVEAASGAKFDGQGALYWDGKGDGGVKKPKFIRIQADGGSAFKNIYLLNCPRQCTSIGNSDGVTLSGWTIDVSAGNSKGKNTDGFDISSSKNIVVENAKVMNQDDCVAVNSGSSLKFSNLQCSGGHGLSLSVGMSKTTYSDNVVSDVTFTDCTVKNSRNGIHVKTHCDAAKGLIKDVTYKNIKLSDITNYGVNVQEDYKNGGSSGKPEGNIPIQNLVLSGVTGSMTGSNSVPVYILCGSGGCSSWKWSGVSISGGHKSSSCNFTPSRYSCK